MKRPISRLSNNPIITADVSYNSNDIPVQSGLALTPGKVQELTAKGIAVSLDVANQTFSASPDRGNFDIDPVYTRDMDRNTLWETSESARHRIFKAQSKVSERVKAQRNANNKE